MPFGALAGSSRDVEPTPINLPRDMVGNINDLDARVISSRAVTNPTLPEPWITAVHSQGQRLSSSNDTTRVTGLSFRGPACPDAWSSSIREPSHDRLICSHVRCHHINVESDELDHLVHLSSRQPLGRRKLSRIDGCNALGPTIRQTSQRTFLTHPNGKTCNLADEPGSHANGDFATIKVDRARWPF